MNDILGYDMHLPGSGRPTPDAAWGLLSQGLTGYDWHGGYYAAPRRPTAGAGNRVADEVRTLSTRERRDAGLPEPTAPRAQRETLWERVAAWVGTRAGIGAEPCPGATR